MTKEQAEVKELYKTLKADFGELLTATQLGKVVGFKNLRTVREWAASEHLEAVIIGKQPKYFARDIAKVLIAKKGYT